MPNHVENHLTFDCSEERLKEILQEIGRDEDSALDGQYGIGTFDFNKVIPMPDDIYRGDLGPKEQKIYEDVGFTEKDHVRLRDALMGIQGKFLLSYNDCPRIRELYSLPGICIESTTRLSNIAQRYDAGKQYPELLIH